MTPNKKICCRCSHFYPAGKILDFDTCIWNKFGEPTDVVDGTTVLDLNRTDVPWYCPYFLEQTLIDGGC
jgi:hypothetical protein